MKFYAVLLFPWLCISATAQALYVDLRVDKMSPLITQYSKTEVENALRDSLVLKLRRGYIERTEKERPITFNPKDEYDYAAELIFIDTVNLNILDSIQTPERLKQVRMATMLYRVYEKKVQDALMPNVGSFMVGYTDHNGNLQQGETEKDIIGVYSSWGGSVFSTSVLARIPYLSLYELTGFNISSKETKEYSCFKEVLVIKTGFDDSVETKSINRLLDDALLREQEFYYGVRSKKENYINIYDREEETFTDHPMKVELTLIRREKGYKAKLRLDGSLTTQHRTFHVPTEFEFTDTQLEHAPSQVLSLFHDMFKKLFRLNLQ